MPVCSRCNAAVGTLQLGAAGGQAETVYDGWLCERCSRTCCGRCMQTKNGGKLQCAQCGRPYLPLNATRLTRLRGD